MRFYLLVSFIIPLCYCTFFHEEVMKQILGDEAVLHSFACDDTRVLPITWTSPIGACGQNGNTYWNKLANSTLSSYFMCLIGNIGKPNPNIGISYPGFCGCPNYCSNFTSAGTCSNQYQCNCNEGWTGPDCSQVTVDNKCSSRGFVANISGITTCTCNPGYSLLDCSSSTGFLPPISQVITPVQQYTGEDEYGNNNPIFNTSVINQIQLTMPPEVLEYILNPANRQSDQYWPVQMWFYNGYTLNDLDDVGFRIKGFSSRNYAKKTFKLSFSKFVDGRKWAQQKKIDLKAMEQDVSAVKEGLVLNMLYSMNAPAQRYGYAQLFINGQNMGAYLMLENIDNQFLKSRFGNDDGALYKCVGTLEYLGTDPDLYKNEKSFGTQAYAAKTDAAEDYTLLRNFIAALNVTSDEEFVKIFPNIFDVDLFARSLAVEVLSGNWDGIWNANNYYLYYNPDVNVFQYIRHDLETSFGVWETFYPFSTRPIYTWGDGGRGYRLINRFLGNEPFRGLFSKYCKQLIDIYFNLEGNFVDRLSFLNNELQPLIYRDQWRMTDFAYSYDQFLYLPEKGYQLETGSNLQKSGTPFVRTLGIKEYMELRIQSALDELEI